MKKLIVKIVTIFFLIQSIVCISVFAAGANKSIYKPSSFGGMDLNSDASQWCYNRSKQSDDFIVFWESGYGLDPKNVADASYRVDVDAVLNVAETAFRIYRDSLKFISGSSKTDSYKMIILLSYSTVWQASGAGVDDMIGQLALSANAAQALGVTVAHEVGHCFQYQVRCDGHPGGWRYGLGDNGAGGNCWWEMCAQWQAFKVYPDQQFTISWFNSYLSSSNKHILHEAPRYSNYFLPDYWSYLHGIDFIGRLWRESNFPEDPVDAYKRIAQVSQEVFNNEIYDCAARFTTWDIPSLRDYGKDFIDSRSSSPMNLTNDNYWLIDSSGCVENYGYNVIRLNVPVNATPIKVYFDGKSGETGFRSINKTSAGWRYGIVALMQDGSRVYSKMRSASFDQIASVNPKDTLIFDCPEKVSKLWLVVTGAPVTHWHHLWDDNDANDEQWPYQVKFDNTNRYGYFNFTDPPHNAALTRNCTFTPLTGNPQPYPSIPVQPDLEEICKAFRLQLSELKNAFGSSIKYCAVEPNGTLNYTSTANAPGHWFNKDGHTTNWGINSFIFSEFKFSDVPTFNIGQYPNLCKSGDNITIRQALVYTPIAGTPDTVTFVFNITIQNQTITFSLPDSLTYGVSPVTLGATSSTGLPVRYTSSDLSIAAVTGNVLTIKGIGTVTVSAIQDENANYSADTVKKILKINKKVVTVSGITALDKIYDGTVKDSLSGGTLNGVLPGDVVTLTPGVGAFVDKNAGKSKTIIVSGYSISGADAGKYTLSQLTGLTAEIVAKEIFVSNEKAISKIFDGTDTISLTAFVSGNIPGDTVVITGKFNDRNTGAEKMVTISIAGPQSKNYSLKVPSPGLSVSIIPKPLSVTGVTVENKMYDGTTVANLHGSTLSGLVSGDSVKLITGTGEFKDKNVGTGKLVTASGYVISGIDAGNYTLNQPADLSAAIAPALLTITANDARKGEKTTDPVFTVTYKGFVKGEDFSVVSGLVIKREAGELPGTYAIIPSGAKADNYKVVYVNGTFSIDPSTAVLSRNDTKENEKDSLKTGIFVKSNPVKVSTNRAAFFVITPFPADIRVMIYDAIGNLLYDENGIRTGIDCKTEILWNLHKKNGNPVGVGTYLIIATVRNHIGGAAHVYRTKIGVKE
jgi:hypothetical protein